MSGSHDPNQNISASGSPQRPISGGGPLNNSMTDDRLQNLRSGMDNNEEAQRPTVQVSPRLAPVANQNDSSNLPANDSSNANNQSNSNANQAAAAAPAPVQDRKTWREDDIAKLAKSVVFPNSTRALFEEQIMERPSAGGGPLGQWHIDLNPLKKKVLDIAPETKLAVQGDMIENLRVDGIYVDDPEVHQKFTDINVQKLEERLLKNDQTGFFKYNGELKLDNDLLADEMTRIADLAFEQPMAFQTKEINALLSDRLNQHKRKYFRLDIVLGKIVFERLKELMSKEDHLAIDMKKQYLEYEMRLSLALIPFYQERIKFLDDEVKHLESYLREGEDVKKQDELAFLKSTLEEVKKKYDKEKQEVNAIAASIFEKWEAIKQERTTNKFASTNCHLKIYKQQMPDGSEEVNFDIQNEHDSKFETPENSSEVRRRNNVKAEQLVCSLLINGIVVAETQRINIEWPKFEAQINEMFQVHVFTMPSSIQLELRLCYNFGDTIVDMIDIEVPGKHVKTLTCASQLIKQLDFSQYTHSKKQKEEDKEGDLDTKGYVYVKAQWKDNGPKLPPIKSENLLKSQKIKKNRRVFDVDEGKAMLMKQLYIDVNDPRNQVILKLIKETKNEFIIKLLADDAKNLLSDVVPFRHKLLLARSLEPGLFSKKNRCIPLLETEIVDPECQENKEYLKILENLFRREAYAKYLNVKPEMEKKDQVDTMDTMFDMYDAGTTLRRNQIMEKINKRKMQSNHQNIKQTSSYKSVVAEPELTYDKNILLAIFQKYFASGRKLKPKVIEQPSQPIDQIKDCKIAVHVIRGENIPIRTKLIGRFLKEKVGTNFGNEAGSTANKPTTTIYSTLRDRALRDLDTGELNRDGTEELGPSQGARGANELHEEPQVQTYVEVKVQYNPEYSIVQNTHVDEGSMPQWNEILEFPLEAIGSKFTIDELAQQNTRIIASIFDKQSYRRRYEDREVIFEEHRFLGSVTIPLHTLLQNPGRFEFNYMIKRPLCLPGYGVFKQDLFSLKDKFGQLNHETQWPATYLNLSITLTPRIFLPYENTEYYYPGAEEQSILEKGTKWVDDLKRRFKKYKKVNINLFGTSVEGHSVLIQRYLSATKPPDQLKITKEGPCNLEKVARFVSLVPFVEDLRMFQMNDMPDLYCTTQQFLDLGGGDYEEHAIMLCNYFNYIDSVVEVTGCKSYLVYGIGMPEGFTVYVMRKNEDPNKEQGKGGFELWYPITGQCFAFNEIEVSAFCKKYKYMNTDLDEPVCPLKQIHMIVGEDNVWVNIQDHDFPLMMNFDLDHRGDWKRFHDGQKDNNGSTGLKYATIQPERPIYVDPKDDQWCELAEQKFQKFLIEKFQNERIDRIKKYTKWDVSINPTIKNQLKNCEKYMYRNRQGGKSSHLKGNPKPKQKFENDWFNYIEKNEQGGSTYQQQRHEESKLQTNTVNTKKGNDQRPDRIIIEEITAIMDERTSNTGKRRVWGNTINVTFVSLDQMWKAIQTTKMYMVDRHDVEFGLTVYIKSYPSNILSVWIYLSAMIDKSLENF